MAHHDVQHRALEPESPERRAFTLQAILAMLSGVTITISGCGNDESPTSPSPPREGDSVGLVSANHGHTAVIESARLMAGNAVSLDIRGTATHPHIVQLTGQEVSRIAAGERVSKISSTDDSPDAGRHSHMVTFN